jgi:hypothetical protein
MSLLPKRIVLSNMLKKSYLKLLIFYVLLSVISETFPTNLYRCNVMRASIKEASNVAGGRFQES